MRLSTISATTAGSEQMAGAPEQLTLIPTTSRGETKRAQASSARWSPVSERIPSASIRFTTARSAFPDFASNEFSACTRTTRPGYGPGMPGWAAAL